MTEPANPGIPPYLPSPSPAGQSRFLLRPAAVTREINHLSKTRGRRTKRAATQKSKTLAALEAMTNYESAAVQKLHTVVCAMFHNLAQGIPSGPDLAHLESTWFWS